MATSRLDRSDPPPSLVVQVDDSEFLLPRSAARFSRNGIEFRSPGSLPLWSEMTVTLRPPGHRGRSLTCTGVVVACEGNRHAGYRVSVLFLNLTRQSQDRLAELASPFAG
jgi:hypothetical protein